MCFRMIRQHHRTLLYMRASKVPPCTTGKRRFPSFEYTCLCRTSLDRERLVNANSGRSARIAHHSPTPTPSLPPRSQPSLELRQQKRKATSTMRVIMKFQSNSNHEIFDYQYFNIWVSDEKLQMRDDTRHDFQMNMIGVCVICLCGDEYAWNIKKLWTA